ncbi:TlpA family protein disulfide reductase [Spirillospora sp. NPDC127200]
MVIALLTLVGLLAALNLLFTYGLIRRVREHEERLARMGPAAPGPPPGRPPAGSVLPEFHAVTVGGREVDRGALAEGDALIGFFDTDCEPCRDRMPEFAEFTAERRSTPVLVVIAGPPAETARWAGLFDDHALVVVEEEARLAKTFGVDGLPTMLALRDGTVEANTTTLDSLRHVTRT